MFMALKLPQSVQKVCCFGLVAIALIYFGAFEFVREGGRRPYIIHGHMYSNQIYLKDVEKVETEGFLASAKWVTAEEVTDANLITAGKDIFKFQCGACHSIGGALNNIQPLTARFDSVFGMDAMLNGLGKLNTYMPPFLGTRAERWALANYIVNGPDIRDRRVSTPQDAPHAAAH